MQSKAEGYKNQVAQGPQKKDGYMTTTFRQRVNGESVKTVEVSCEPVYDRWGKFTGDIKTVVRVYPMHDGTVTQYRIGEQGQDKILDSVQTEHTIVLEVESRR
jgi:hypothetical protein